MYQKPDIDIIEVKIEAGFSATQNSNMENPETGDDFTM